MKGHILTSTTSTSYLRRTSNHCWGSTCSWWFFFLLPQILVLSHRCLNLRSEQSWCHLSSCMWGRISVLLTTSSLSLLEIRDDFVTHCDCCQPTVISALPQRLFSGEASALMMQNGISLNSFGSKWMIHEYLHFPAVYSWHIWCGITLMVNVVSIFFFFLLVAVPILFSSLRINLPFK